MQKLLYVGQTKFYEQIFIDRIESLGIECNFAKNVNEAVSGIDSKQYPAVYVGFFLCGIPLEGFKLPEEFCKSFESSEESFRNYQGGLYVVKHGLEAGLRVITLEPILKRGGEKLREYQSDKLSVINFSLDNFNEVFREVFNL